MCHHLLEVFIIMCPYLIYTTQACSFGLALPCDECTRCIFYQIVQSWSTKWLYSLYCVVFMAIMSTNVCGLYLLERSLLPSDTQITQVVATQNTNVNVHAVHCATLALRGIPGPRAQVQSMDVNCGEWVECMGVASGRGEQEVGVASGSGWNLWVWLLGVVVRRYIDFLPVLFYFLQLKFIYYIIFSLSINTHTGNYGHPTAAI